MTLGFLDEHWTLYIVMYQVCVPKDSAMPIDFFTSQGNVTTSAYNGLENFIKHALLLYECLILNHRSI